MAASTLNILDNDELLGLTRWQLDQGQFGDALISVKHILERDDKPLEGFRLGAKIYAQLGLFDHAKQAFKTFLEASPDALTEMFQYGMVHYDSGELEKAIEIQNVLDKQATHPPALFYRALGLANQHNTSEALQHLDVLIKSAPADNLYFERGRELMRSIEQNQAAKIEQPEESQERKLEKYGSDDDRTIN